jgi:hypothetical protein
MHHNPTLYAIKLLKQHFIKNIDKAQEACTFVKEGKRCPISTRIGNAPQDRHMVLKVLTSKQILAVLEEVIHEHRPNCNRHAMVVPRCSKRIVKVQREKGNTTSQETKRSNHLG